MVTMVDPPGGWAYGFPAPLQGDYEKQLRDAGYPESDIPLALEHSWYHTTADMPAEAVKATYGIDVGQPGGDHTAYTESYMDPETGKIVIHEMRIVEANPALELIASKMPCVYTHLANPQRGECWAKDRFTGTASDGDDGA